MNKLTKLSRSVEGKVAVVTGAASGMGRAEALVFAEAGCRVAVTDVNGDGASEVAAAINDAGGEARAWSLDVGSTETVESVVGEIAAHFGSIDILINNAGIAGFEAIEADGYEALWDRMVNVNLTGELRMIRACLPHLQAAGNARIVNIASTEGLGATAYNSPYVAAKHGVVGLTKALAVEFGRTGMTVNCICPGPIHTGMTSVIEDADKTKFARRRVPLRRYGDPEEVAHIVLGLTLPASSYLNGAIIPVDGGLRVQNT